MQDPLILYQPSVEESGRRPFEPHAEQVAYSAQHRDDIWLTDVQQVYRRFFGPGTAFASRGRRGFFLEAGAVQGTVYDSNSLFFERFLGWRGCSLRPTHSALPSCWCDVLHHIDWNLHSAQLLVLCASTFLTISVLQMGAAAGQTERASTSSDVLPLAQSSDKLGSSMWTFGASMSKARRCAAGIEQNSRTHC